MIRTLSIFFLSIISFNVAAQNVSLVDPYQTAVPGVSAEKIGVYIEDLRTGEVVLDVNGEVPLIPASVTKVITTATAINSVNLNSCYKTEVYAHGKINNGILNGNIVVNACGDPTIESSNFKQKAGVADSIAMAFSRLGIKEVIGKIVVNEPSWLNENIPAGWGSDDVNWPYGASHFALNYYDNKITLNYPKSGNYTCSPTSPGVKFMVDSKKGAGSVWRERNSTTYHVVPAAKKPISVTLANPSPQSAFIHALKVALGKYGIAYTETTIATPSGGKKLVYTHCSPTHYDIMRSMMLRSDNQIAEATLRLSSPGKSRSEAAQRELNLWAKRGVDVSDLVIEDGSGLSRNNRITPYALADILVWMHDNSKDFVSFLNMFPRSGQTGTMRNFLKGTKLEGKLWTKTGSMSGVQCYAGFVVNGLGSPTHVVVIMVNGFKGDRAKLKMALQDMLIEKLL